MVAALWRPLRVKPVPMQWSTRLRQKPATPTAGHRKHAHELSVRGIMPHGSQGPRPLTVANQVKGARMSMASMAGGCCLVQHARHLQTGP